MLPDDITQVNTTSDTDQRNSSIATLEGGGTVVVWYDFPEFTPGSGTDGGSILAQIFDEDGNKVGGEIIVEPGLDQAALGEPTVTSLSDGGFAVGWTAQ